MQRLDPETAFEVVKLLVQVAWGDLQLVEEERVWLHAAVERLRLRPDHMTRVESWLNRSLPLEPPKIPMLQQHRAIVLDAAAELIRADGVVRPDELEVLREIETMLR